MQLLLVTAVFKMNKRSDYIVKYFGYNGVINNSSEFIQDILTKLECSNKKLIDKGSYFSKDLVILLTEAKEMLIISNNYQIPYYKLILLNDLIIPYLDEMLSRVIAVDTDRYDQLTFIMKLIVRVDDRNISPILALQDLDLLQLKINNKFSIWKSQLGIYIY